MPRMPDSVLRARRKAREERKKKAAASKRGRRHYVTRRREEIAAKKAAAERPAAERPAAKKAAAARPAAKKAAAKRPAAKKAAAARPAARRSSDQVLADSRRNSAQRKATAARSRAVTVTPRPPVGSAPVDRVKTKGGEYKVYKKKSEAAQSFRAAFRKAKNKGQKTFTWDGRRYTTKTK